MIYQKTLHNGIRIIVDEMHDVKSCTVAIGFGTGSINETKAQNGISHFLEHMAFKGTERRSAFDISHEVECFGGAMNAFTSYDKTVYYIKAQSIHLEKCVDILADIILNSTFDEAEIEKERSVILQELASSLDTPDDIVFDLFKQQAYGDTPLGRTILGSQENIKSFTKQHLQEYIQNQYTGHNMVFSVAGNVSHQNIFDLAEQYFGTMPTKQPKQGVEHSKYIGGRQAHAKNDLSQVQFMLGFETIPCTDPQYYTASVASAILGKGMSSRLFQEVRERLGLCYTIACFYESYSNCAGMFSIYSGTSPEDTQKLEDAITKELLRATKDITKEELSKVLEQYKSSIIFSDESTSLRAQKGISNLLTFNRYIPEDEIISKVGAITVDDIQNYILQTVGTDKTQVMYGNIPEESTFMQQG